jgi:hypothetical protein
MILLPGPISDVLSRLFRGISEQWSGAGRRWVRATAVVAGIAILAGLHVRSSWGMWQQGISPWEIGVEARSYVPGMPVRAVSLMKSHGISGRLVTDYGWGQYVLWHLYPGVEVAFDGRYRTVYPPEVEREFMAFQKLTADDAGPTPILDRYATEIALLPVKSSVCGYLDGRDDWVLLFRDEQSALYVADVPKFRELIERVRRSPFVAADVPVWQRFPGDGR